MDFIIGFLLSTLIGSIAYKKQSLDFSGLLTAILIGTLLYGFVGAFSFAMLMLFFISSSLISRLNPDKKSSRRSSIQVLANGGVVGILSVIYGLRENSLVFVLILTSIAIAASDTWSGEIGRLSKKLPKVIFTNKIVPKGLSGGVTPLGFFASFLAAFIFASLSLFVVDIYDALLIFVFAFLGGILDSLLGIVQVKYKDIKNDVLTEKTGPNIVYYSGFRWLDNNLVNFLSNGGAVLLLMLIYLTF